MKHTKLKIFEFPEDISAANMEQIINDFIKDIFVVKIFNVGKKIFIQYTITY